jgi:cytidylate kinase
MNIDLVQYMKSRYLEKNSPSHDPGPVVTIAREMGCPGKKVAQLLTEYLNQKSGKKDDWKWIGKEIFDEAAKELELPVTHVKNVFKTDRGIIDQIVSAQTQKFYKNDLKVRKTIGQVIRAMANDGHVIILGRGGVALTRDISHSLHIFLEAPLQWRVSLISEKQGYNPDEAKKYVQLMDKRRAKYREYYQGKNTDYTWYDIKFNCMTLSAEEIVEAIIKVMEIRKLI